MSFTSQWGLEKPDSTTQNKTSVYNAGLDRIDEGRRYQGVAGTALGPYHLVHTNSGGFVNLASGAHRPLLGFVSSSGSTVSSVSSGGGVYVQVDGFIINSVWAFTPGGVVFAHPSATGSITQTVPGSLAWPIGWAMSSHQLGIFPGGLVEVHSGTQVFDSVILAAVGSAGAWMASSRLGTRHWGTATPTGGVTGEIAVNSGRIYVNDGGSWKSVSVT